MGLIFFAVTVGLVIVWNFIKLYEIETRLKRIEMHSHKSSNDVNL